MSNYPLVEDNPEIIVNSRGALTFFIALYIHREIIVIEELKMFSPTDLTLSSSVVVRN